MATSTQIDGLPAIPTSWLIFIFIVGMIIMRAMNIDSWTTAILSSVATWLFGKEFFTSQSTQQVQDLQGELITANSQIKDLESQLAQLTGQKGP